MDSPRILEFLQEVKDPEIPVLSVVDMGVVRRVERNNQGWKVFITPTYSGCPAMDVIAREIKETLEEKGCGPVMVEEVLSPPWTTDWLTENARKALEEYGIAPPVNGSADKRVLFGKQPTVKCPHCGSLDTEMVSQFGSTACKSLYRCASCSEPFDYFKCI